MSFAERRPLRTGAPAAMGIRIAIAFAALVVAPAAKAQSGNNGDAPAPTPPAEQRDAVPTPPGKDDQRLAPVEITGKRLDEVQERRNSTAAKIIIGRDEIDRFGDSTLGDVLKRLPGVTIQGRPGRGGAIRLRGLGNGYTQTLLDGERVPPGFSLDSLTPDQVERIEILRAPTAETGARAIAGTITIITRGGYTKRVNDVRVNTGYENGHPQPSISWTRNIAAGTFIVSDSLSAYHIDRDNSAVTTTVDRRLDDDSVTLAQVDDGPRAHARRAGARTRKRRRRPSSICSCGSSSTWRSGSTLPSLRADGAATGDRRHVRLAEQHQMLAQLRDHGRRRALEHGSRRARHGGEHHLDGELVGGRRDVGRGPDHGCQRLARPLDRPLHERRSADVGRNLVERHGDIRPHHLGIDEASHDVVHHVEKRLAARFAAGRLNRLGHLVHVGLQQGEQQRLLVRVVLVERSDRDSRALGHASGRQPVDAVAEQNLNGRLRDRLDGGRRTLLNGRFSWLIRSCGKGFQNANSRSEGFFIS